MDNLSLTKDAEKLICIMYKNYLEKRKAGEPKSKAKKFGGSNSIHEKLLPKWSFQDVDDTCRELSRAGLLSCMWASDVAYNVSLSDSGISYMENRFKNGLKEVTDFISKILSSIPL